MPNDLCLQDGRRFNRKKDASHSYNFRLSCYYNDTQQIKKYLQSNRDNDVSYNGYEALSYVCENGNEEIFRLLLRQKIIDLGDLKDYFVMEMQTEISGPTIMQQACIGGNLFITNHIYQLYVEMGLKRFVLDILAKDDYILLQQSFAFGRAFMCLWLYEIFSRNIYIYLWDSQLKPLIDEKIKEWEKYPEWWLIYNYHGVKQFLEINNGDKLMDITADDDSSKTFIDGWLNNKKVFYG